jgi:hypothetical protein
MVSLKNIRFSPPAERDRQKSNEHTAEHTALGKPGIPVSDGMFGVCGLGVQYYEDHGRYTRQIFIPYKS